MLQTAYSVASDLLYRRKKPGRDIQYLRWIRKFPCVGCGTSRWIEAAHIGPHGIGQKADDREALPLCYKCHRTDNDSLHKIGPVKFQQRKNICFADLIAYFQGMYK